MRLPASTSGHMRGCRVNYSTVRYEHSTVLTTEPEGCLSFLCFAHRKSHHQRGRHASLSILLEYSTFLFQYSRAYSGANAVASEFSSFVPYTFALTFPRGLFPSFKRIKRIEVYTVRYLRLYRYVESTLLPVETHHVYQ